IEVLGGDALVADRGRLQQHDARHRDNDSHGLALTIEVAREQRRQPDEREGKGVPWTRETLVRLDEKPRGVEAVVRVAQVGMQELIEEALVGAPPARLHAAREPTEIDAVFVEVKQRQPAVRALDCLAIAIEENNARARGRRHDGAALGNVADGPGGDTHVVHEDAEELAAGLALADIYRETLAQGVELALLEEDRGKIVSDPKLDVLEAAIGGRHEVQVESIAAQHDD